MKIEFFRHNIEEEDIEHANTVLRSIFLTTGSEVAEFENELAQYLGVQAVVGVTSCTGALHLGLVARDIGPGDEVITTPLSYIATATSIECAGATPVIVDVEEDTGNMQASAIEQAITSRTRAIMPVHLYGLMCDMHYIGTVAKKYSLRIIEDAAHSLESQRDSLRPGTIGDMACFSFYATKNITSGEGGAIATNDTNLAERLRRLRSHGVSKEAADRYTKKYQHYDMTELGWKYNMDNIQAALLRGQLRRIDDLRQRRQNICIKYDDAFRSNENIVYLQRPSTAISAHHLYTILVDPEKRDTILHHLQEKGIGVAVNYRPIHLMSYFKNKYGFTAGSFPVAESIGARTITIPLYPKLKNEEVHYVIERVLEALRVC